MTKQNSLYAQAGVDIDAGDALVQRIKPFTQRTRIPGVLGGLGGFGGLFELPSGYEQPVLVSGTDGVGTKLKLAQQLSDHSTIGIDLVAMCVNDIAVSGAKPLFFLDYYACGQLNVDNAAQVIQGIALGCEEAGCALIGGETAEMPGMYQGEEYDLAGFAVGIVEKAKIITGDNIKAGDQIIGVASSGVHANGFSLVRKLLTDYHIDLHMDFFDGTLGDALLTPTEIYVTLIQSLLERFAIKGMAHITGGGLLENIPRVFAKELQAELKFGSWQAAPIFAWMQQLANISDKDMWRTFNCGLGLVCIVDQNDLPAVLSQIKKTHRAWHIGAIKARSADAASVVIR